MSEEIKPGDLFDNPEGKFAHTAPGTFLVCSLSFKKLDEKDLWNCLQLWFHKSGMRTRSLEGYETLLSEELLQLKKVGNVYDAINQTYGELTGTKKSD